MYLQAVCRLVSTKVYPLDTSSCVLVTKQVCEKILILFYLLSKMSYRVLCSFFFFNLGSPDKEISNLEVSCPCMNLRH